ncbi:MAG TPA: TetR family transcriptional regulator C-terminal domain-containing protein [Acetobacteraceae bacterium]|nr:TetR family transcriptional regulator C-terminal domain-containing protein [Acetobacteraceae bacterium]
MTLAEPTQPRQHRMPRAERRQLAIETTLTSLVRRGAEGTSLRGVCRDMGVTPTLLRHSFAGWHELLIAAYNVLTERYMAQLAPGAGQEFPSAEARMSEVIRCYLATDWFGENTMGAMIAFWHLSRKIVELQEPLARFMARRHAVVREAVTALAAARNADIDADQVAGSFILMMDGIWLHMSLRPDTIDSARAQEISWAWMRDRLGKSARLKAAGATNDNSTLPSGTE